MPWRSTPARTWSRRARSTLSWLPYLPFRRLLGRQPTGITAYVAAEVERSVGERLLLLDDLHWADPESRAVAVLLAGRVAWSRRCVAATPRRQPCSTSWAPPDSSCTAARAARGDRLGRARRELAAESRPRHRRRARPALQSGNPLLLEELAAGGEPTESLRRAVAARLRTLPADGVESMAVLSLAGQPLPTPLVPAADALVDAGLAVASDGTVAVRHALLAETAVTVLDAARRRTLHERLARRLGDPGEAAP